MTSVYHPARIGIGGLILGFVAPFGGVRALRAPAAARLGSFAAVVDGAGAENLAHAVERAKHGLVQKFVAQPAVAAHRKDLVRRGPRRMCSQATPRRRS
mgnify:CR=1 FL=1